MRRVVAAAAYTEGTRVADIALDEGREWAGRPGAEELTTLQRQFDLHELAVDDARAQGSKRGQDAPPRRSSCGDSSTPGFSTGPGVTSVPQTSTAVSASSFSSVRARAAALLADS